MTLSDSDIGANIYSDMGHWHFLNSTGDIGNDRLQRHAALAFLKIDMRHQDPLSRAPVMSNKLSPLMCYMNSNTT